MKSVEVPEYEIQEEVRVDPGHTALIVGDMQNDFVKEDGTLVVPDAEATIPKIQNLLALARESGWTYLRPGNTTTKATWSGRSGESTARGQLGRQIVDELRPLENEVTIRKPGTMPSTARS